MAKKGLGRGLDALMPVDFEEAAVQSDSKEFIKVKLSYVEPNREQPRKSFDEEELEALAESIKEYGIIQPITVKDEGNGFYSIIAGERRWRAAKLAGLSEVPVRIVEFSKEVELEVALIENLQRSDLNPVEEALGYKKLMEEHNLTQEDVSKKVGKSRSAVANALRLLALSDKVLKLLEDKKLTGGHAKAILLVKNEGKRDFLAEKIVEEDLSVRMAEKWAAYINEEKDTKKPAKARKKSPEVMDLEKDLSETWGTKIVLEQKKKGGKIEIEYYDKEQLEVIISFMRKYKG